MNTLYKIAFSTLCFLFVMNCSTGFDRGKLHDSTKFRPLNTTDKEIDRILKLKPQIHFPFKLAIWIDGDDPLKVYSKPDDQILFQKFIADLKQKGIISDAIFISQSLVEEEKLQFIRLAAARYNADAVLSIRSSKQIDSYPNFMSILYLTVIGFWIFPGSTRDSIFYISGTLWDVRNEYLYLTAESEGEAKIIRPLIYANRDTVVTNAKEKSLDSFLIELKSRFYSIKGI